jgi:AcrR family transcriptional regulator
MGSVAMASNGVAGDMVTGSSRETVPGWEERSVQRVVEAGREQILERSRKIVEAAYELLDEGLEELTIRAVLGKTGLSRRAFYERFSGKDDLVVAVFEHTIRLAESRYREQIDLLNDPMERLHLIVSWLVRGREALPGAERDNSGRRGAAMSREHLRLAESRPEELQVALQPLISLIAEQLSDGMAAGVVRDGDPRRMASLVYNLVSTTVHTELLSSETAQADREQLAAEIWDFCQRAVAVSPGS